MSSRSVPSRRSVRTEFVPGRSLPEMSILSPTGRDGKDYLCDVLESGRAGFFSVSLPLRLEPAVDPLPPVIKPLDLLVGILGSLGGGDSPHARCEGRADRRVAPELARERREAEPGVGAKDDVGARIAAQRRECAGGVRRHYV